MISPNFAISEAGLPGMRDFYEVIHKIGKPKHVRKGEFIIREGSPASYFIYIRKGAFKTVVKTPRKNYTLAFTFADDIDCCPASLLNGVPNSFSIQAIADSDVLICDFNSMTKAIGKEGYLNFVVSILLHYASFLESQLIEQLSLTAEQRYNKLLTQQADKLSLVPLSLLASYLGITLERLSRIRKKLKV